MRSFLCFMLFMLLASHAMAQWADMAHDEAVVSFGYSGQDTDSTVTATAVLPFTINESGRFPFSGWAGGFMQQIAVDGDIESQVVKTKLEGGFDVWQGVNIVGFVENERDEARGIDGQQSIGFFVRPGVFRHGAWRVSGGAGNFVENAEFKEEFEIDEAVTVLARGLVFGSVSWRNASVRIEMAPNVEDARDFDAKFEPAYSVDVSDKLSVVFSGLAEYESRPAVVAKHWCTSWTIAGQFRF